MKRFYNFFSLVVFLFITSLSIAQIPYDRPCYGINAGLDSTFCSSGCKSFTRVAIPDHENRSTTSYAVQQMTMPSPAYITTGTNTIVDQDDIYGPVVPLGFNFCFFGNTYNSIVIGANGILSFNLAYAGQPCPWSYTGGLPLCCTTGNRLNSIMGPYTDIDPSVGFNPNRINWYREGVAPCRRFVVNFYQVPYFFCNATIMSAQIILHEAYNIIDVVIANKPVCSTWNAGQAIIGIQDATGANWYAAPGNNPSTSPESNICYRFLPNGPLMQTINWTQGATVVSNTATLNPTICPTSTTNYVANLVNQRCDGTSVTVTDDVNFTVNQAPVPSAGIDKSLNCPSGTVSIGSPTIGGHTYSWSPAAGLSNAGVSQPTATVANTYILTETNSATGCITKDTVIVSNPIPPVANAGPDKTLGCTPVIIGTAAVAGYTYSWSPTTGLINPTSAQPTATSSGTFMVTVTNTANGCTAMDAVNVTGSITFPIANAGPDKLLTCTNPSYVIGTPAVAGNTYSWSPSAGLDNAGIAQPTDTLGGTYILTVTNASGCSSNDTVIVTQNKTLPLADAGPDQTLTCTNPSYVIGTPAIGGNSYSWSPAAGLNSTVIAQPTDTSAGTFTVTVTNLTNGCTATDAVTISKNKTLPLADAGPDQTLTCTNPSYVIGTAAIGGNSYSWSPAAGLNSTVIAQPTDTSTGTFTVIVTNLTNGCTATDAVTISKNKTLPLADAGPDQTLTCTNPSYVIGTAAIAGNTYSWIPTAGLINPASAQPTDTSAGTYTVTVTNTANGCQSTDAVTMSVNKVAPLANAGSDQTLTCTNPSYIIGTAAIAGNTYSWTPTAGLINPASAEPTDTSAGTYTVTVTNTANGCQSTDAVTMSVNKVAPLANAGPDQTLTCTNPSYVIGTAAIAGNTYSWTPTTGLINPASAEPTDTSAGTYTVTVTNTANGCQSTDAVTISKNKILPLADAGANQTLTCTNPSYTIGTAAIGGNTYSWTPTAGLINPASAQPTDTSAGTYTVTVTNTANGCQSTDAVTMSVNKVAPLANAGPDQTLTCTNPSYIIGTAAIAGNTYSWTPTAGLINPASAEPTDTSAGTYTVTVTNTANGCQSTDAVTISKNKMLPLADAGADQTLTCTNPSYIIGTAAIGGNTYSWTPTAGLINPASAEPTDTSAGTYTVTVTNTANGCQSTDAVTMSVNKVAPLANAGSDQTLTCTNPSYIIGAAAIAGNTYSWTPTAGLINPASAEPTDTSAGTYTVTVTNTANGCQSTDAVTMSVNKVAPLANAGPDQTLTCTNPSYIIGTAAIAGNTYSWTPTTGLINPASAEPTDTSAGTYTVTVTNMANGCQSTDAVTMSVNKVAPLANAGPDQTLTCTNPSYIIGTAAIAGNSYTWSPSAGLDNAAIAQPIDTSAGIYTVTVKNLTNGCTATDAVTISVDKTLPIADAGLDKTLTCTTTFVVIGTPFSSGYAYSWSPVLGVDNATAAQPAASLPNTYTLTVKKGSNGCTATDAVNVLIDTIHPLANAGPDKTLTCTTKSVSIGTAAITGNTYVWIPVVGSINSTSAQTTADHPNRYAVTVTNTANGCKATDSVTVFKDTIAPFANAGPDSTLTCTIKNIKIGTIAIAGNTYSWSPATGSINPAIAQPTADLAGLYTVTVTKTVNGCTATDAVTILKDTIPPSANAGADKTITCTDTSVVIGTAAIAGDTYSWLPSTGLIGAATAQPTANLPDNYSVTVTKTSNGCTATDNVNVSIDTIYPLADAGPDMKLTCAVRSVSIGTTGITGNTYSWSPPAGLNNSLIPQPTDTVPGVFIVTVKHTTNGCTSTAAVKITQDTISPLADAGRDTTLTCSTTNVVIGTAAIAGNTYAWSPIAGLDDPTKAQPTSDSAITYRLIVTNVSNGCKSADVINVRQNITTSAAIAGADRILTCLHRSYAIGAASVSGNSYSWSPSSGLSDSSVSDPVVSEPGNYVLTVTNNANGCTSFDNISISRDTVPPLANAGADKALTCVTKSVVVGTTAIAGNTYSWSPVAGLNNTSAAQPTAIIANTYTVTVMSLSNGCTASDSVTVPMDTITPVANAGDPQTFSCPHDSLTLGTAEMSNTSYHWTPAPGLSAVDVAQPTTTDSGTFVLYVINIINGCRSLPDSVTITDMNCSCEFYVPSAFTPNNDGLNDVLYAFRNCTKYLNFNFSVFNRWGELVFTSNDVTSGWDGFFKSEAQQIDSYVWTISYFDVLHNENRFQKGTVVLLK